MDMVKGYFVRVMESFLSPNSGDYIRANPGGKGP